MRIPVGLVFIIPVRQGLLKKGCCLFEMNGKFNYGMKCPTCGALILTDEMSRFYRCAFCKADIDYWERKGWGSNTFRVEKGLLVVFGETTYRQ